MTTTHRSEIDLEAAYPWYAGAKERLRADVEAIVQGMPMPSSGFLHCDRCDFTTYDQRGLASHIRGKHSR